MAILQKWLIRIVLGLMVLGGGLYVLVAYYVGAINVPLPNDDLIASQVVTQLKVPKGFSISVYADNVDNARLLRFSRTGDLLVATPNLDKIDIISRDANDDGRSDGQRTLLADLNGPNGMDFYQDWLYIAETDAIGRIQFNHKTGETVGDYERIVTGLPGGGNHWKKTLRFGPDGLMYVTMGSSCNVCEEEDARRATLVRYQPDGSGETIFARGLRNSAGFDWSPVDGKIYGTDNGRDMLGDDFPSCELNQIQEDAHYGWPYVNGANLADPDFGDKKPESVNSFEAPVFEFKPHNAPLGIEFVRDKHFPEDYQNAAIVALHGSWNRSDKDGYKVVSLHWDDAGHITSRDFVTGFLVDDDVSGRPAEVTEGPDGAFYISDDYAQVIYRVAYGEADRKANDESKRVAQQSTAVEKPDSDFSATQTLGALEEQVRSDYLAAGEKLYNQFRCISCHNDNGRGLKVLSNLGEKYDLTSLSAYLRRPQAPMPIFPLSDSDRTALGVYLINRYPGN